MRRRIIPIASLLVCIATVAIWIRSCRIQDEWVVARATPVGAQGENLAIWMAETQGRSCKLIYYNRTISDLPELNRWLINLSHRPLTLKFGWECSHDTRPAKFTPRENFSNRLGFACASWQDDTTNDPGHGWTIGVPFWLIGLAFAMPPLRLLFTAVRRSRRSKRGNCGGCGYNLIANASGVCPECGVTIPV